MIRFVNPETDAKYLLDIYAPYIKETSITFEYTVPELESFTQRIKSISSRYPYIVYEQNSKILGYAYASRLAERKAYQWNVEVSIYLDKKNRRQGLGTELYTALHKLLQAAGYILSFSLITGENTTSLEFHKRFGYTTDVCFKNQGYKFGKWHDVYWMEKNLMPDGNLPGTPLVPLLPGEIPQHVIRDAFGEKN
ncbi:MAG: GNAT family N-acetyltransferase [Treponema sp.]|jgi:phosphinothricin acetyltransferase|nr:GNAT family N-acetyltransferase [Treponema sp.]